MIYWIGGAVLAIVILSVVVRIAYNRMLKREFLIQLAIAKRKGEDVIHWDPDNIR